MGVPSGLGVGDEVYFQAPKQNQPVPTSVVGGYCAATAVLSALAHTLVETTVGPASGREWLAVAGLGLLDERLELRLDDVGEREEGAKRAGRYRRPRTSSDQFSPEAMADSTLVETAPSRSTSSRPS